MQQKLIAIALAAAFVAPAFAEEAAPTPEHTLTGNIGLVSSYRFRGIDQTFGKPALQGGFDYSHASGFYAGNWDSNVSSGAGYPNGNLEMDFYGGYKRAFGDFGLDVGALYYYYPGSNASGLSNDHHSGHVNNQELYIAGSWKFISLKYSRAMSDYFGVRTADDESTKGTGYWDLSANYDLGNGWGVNGHVGRLNVRHLSEASYTDWKLGVTKDINGWVLGASYVGTNAKGDCDATSPEIYCLSNSSSWNGSSLTAGDKTKDGGRGIGVLSVSKTF